LATATAKATATVQPANAIKSQIKLNQLGCSQLASKLIFVLPPHRFGLQ